MLLQHHQSFAHKLKRYLMLLQHHQSFAKVVTMVLDAAEIN